MRKRKSSHWDTWPIYGVLKYPSHELFTLCKIIEEIISEVKEIEDLVADSFFKIANSM